MKCDQCKCSIADGATFMIVEGIFYHPFCYDVKMNANSTVDDRQRRNKLRCSLCPPNRKENAKRKPKHGVKTPKGKDHK